MKRPIINQEARKEIINDTHFAPLHEEDIRFYKFLRRVRKKILEICNQVFVFT